MRHLLAIAVLGLLGTASVGCRGAGARILSADAPHPEVAELFVRTRVTRLWNRQEQCRVVAEYAGYRGEAGVVMTEGVAVEEVTSPIALWAQSPEAPFDHVRVTFFLRDRKLHTAQFPPPFDPRAFTLPQQQPPERYEPQPQPDRRHENLLQPEPRQPANPLTGGGEETRREDLRRGQQQPAQPAGGGQSQQTDLLRAAPCPVCDEPRGNQSPCPHCGID